MAVQVCSGTYNQQLSFSETATIAFNTSAPFAANQSTNFTLPNATAGALNIDTIHAKQYTLAATTIAIDLFGGSLLSPSGLACVFARVRFFGIQIVDTTATHIIKCYASASNAPLWLPPVANYLWATPNGGNIQLFDPNSLTTNGYLVDTSHKAVTFDAGAFTIVFNLLILGNSSAS